MTAKPPTTAWIPAPSGFRKPSSVPSHWAWRYFTPTREGRQIAGATCNLCGQHYSKKTPTESMSKHLLQFCVAVTDDLRPVIEAKSQEVSSKAKANAPVGVPQIFGQSAAAFDPSSIDLSQLEGVQLPSVYEASLISPQLRDFVVWYEAQREEKARTARTEERYQAQIKRQQQLCREEFLSVKGEKHSRLLEEALLRLEAGQKCSIGEEEFIELYTHICKHRADKFEDVYDTTYYCYFLIDASKLRLTDQCFKSVTFGQFLDAIFYIGKGTGARAMSHLQDAVLFRLHKDPKEARKLCPGTSAEKFSSVVRHLKNPRKLDHILDIWSHGNGIVVYDGFLRGLCSYETCSFEAAMLLAYGRENLLNERDATPKPPTDQWSAEKRAKLGVNSLVRAYEAFRRFVTQPHFEPDYHDYIADYVDRKLYLRGKRAGQRKRRAGGVVPVEEVHLSSSDEEENSKEEDEIVYVISAK